MNNLKTFLFTLLVLLGVSFTTNVHADENRQSINTASSSIELFGSKVISYTKRSATLSGLTNSIVYNDGIYCGVLTLQSWSYDKDLSTGKMWYVGIYKGTVQSNGGCPSNKFLK